MSPALTSLTTIRPADQPANPLDTAIHTAGRKLCALQMTRLWGQADKSDAQSLTRDLLDIARIVDLSLFTDQLLGAVEGNAIHTICAAIEAREEEIEAEIGDWRYKNKR